LPALRPAFPEPLTRCLRYAFGSTCLASCIEIRTRPKAKEKRGRDHQESNGKKNKTENQILMRLFGNEASQKWSRYLLR
jgi:hypothetical protein